MGTDRTTPVARGRRMGKGAEGPAQHGEPPAGSEPEPVAAGAEPRADTAEVRQIDAMNEFASQQSEAGAAAAADPAGQ